MSKSKTMKEIQDIVWKTHVDKGWDKTRTTALENHALFHSEIAEATECVRNGEDPCWIFKGKPEGEAIELADVVIRIMNYFRQKFEPQDIYLEDCILIKNKYNMTRKTKHGKLI